MRRKVVYFTIVDISSPGNGGSICCRNHIQRLNADTEIELFVVLAGNEKQKAYSLAYLDGLGVAGEFLAFRDPDSGTKLSFAETFVPIPWKEFARFQKHMNLSN